MGREVERKYRVLAPNTHSQLDEAIRALGGRLVAIGTDVDTYWRTPTGGIARYRSRIQTGEAWLTVKHKDKGTNEDRSEVETPVEIGVGERLLTAALGPSLGFVEKHFSKFEAFPELEIAAYRVVGHDGIFLEIESKRGSLDDIKRFEGHFIAENVEFVQEKQSIFEMFIAPLERGKAA